MANFLSRLRSAFYLSFITALWCWVLIACYVIWKFGYREGYLELGEIPFYYLKPVNYLTLFMINYGAFAITFVAAFILCLLVPKHWRIAALWIAWLLGAGMTAFEMAFLFLDHGGGTWLPIEAFLHTFFHPTMTLVWVVVGLAGTELLTRFLRR